MPPIWWLIIQHIPAKLLSPGYSSKSSINKKVLVFLAGAPLAIGTAQGLHTGWWLLTVTLCFSLVSLYIGVSLSASIMTLVAIAMDRYLLIVRYKKKKLSTKQSLKIIVIIWFLSQVPSSPLLLYSKTYRAQVGQDEYKTKCFESWPSVAIRHSYSLLVFLVFYFIPLSVISWMYIKIVRKLRNALPESRKG